MSLEKQLEAIVGKNDKKQSVTQWLDTGYAPLNKIISGSNTKGIPQGRIIEIFGPSSSGKTAIATQIMIESQRAGGIAMFNDHEYSFIDEFAVKMGLDVDHRWIYKRPKTWEESNTLAMKLGAAVREKKLIAPEAPIVCVFDSVAAMIPKSSIEKGIDEYTMNDTTALARVSSTTLKAVNRVINENNITVLYLNQIRTKPGVMFGDPTTTPGGGAFEFYASVRLALGKKKITEGTPKVVVGTNVTAKTTKNKINRPFQSVTWNFMFRDDGSGYFDTTSSLVDYLKDSGKLKAVGNKLEWIDGSSYTRKTLISKIEKEGQQEELNKLLG